MVDNLNTAISSRLRIAIGDVRGMKRRIAEACGVSPQAITGWLNNGAVDYKHMPVVSRLTGVNLYWLMTGDGEPWGDKGGSEALQNLLSMMDEKQIERTLQFAQFELSLQGKPAQRQK